MISIVGLYEEEGCNCYWCGNETKLPKKNKQGKPVINRDTATREHLIPKSDGGLNNRSNIKLACYDCNKLRGTLHAVTWKIIASNRKTLNSYVAARNDRKRLVKIEGKERRHVEKILRDATGIICRHQNMPIEQFNEVFGEQHV